jgi:hypothetical protein
VKILQKDCKQRDEKTTRLATHLNEGFCRDPQFYQFWYRDLNRFPML